LISRAINQTNFKVYNDLCTSYCQMKRVQSSLSLNREKVEKMPTLRIDTNVSKSKIDLDGFSNDLTKAIAESLNKPIGYVLVIIHPDVAMTYGEGEGKNPD